MRTLHVELAENKEAAAVRRRSSYLGSRPRSTGSPVKIITLTDIYLLFVIFLIKITSLPPVYKWKRLIFSGIAMAAFSLSRRKRRLIEKNISVAFGPKLTTEQTRRIVTGAFHGFWQEVFSILLSRHEASAAEDVNVCGFEHLETALNKGRGVILWESSGFGEKTTAKRILHERGFLICQVHGMNNVGGFLTLGTAPSWVRYSWIKRLFDTWEKRFVCEIIDLPNLGSLAVAKTLFDRLKRNAIVCIAGDGKTGKKFISLKFLGHTEFFSTGMVSLSRISGATILPIFCMRERNGKRYLVIERPIAVARESNRECTLKNSVAKYAALLERYIRRYPEQYRNWHLVSDHSEHAPIERHDKILASRPAGDRSG